MRQFRMFGIAVAMSIGFAVHGYAELMLGVDLDAATPGIQASRVFASGDTFTANLVLNLTGSTSLSAYQFSIGFDRTEISFVSRTETAPAGFGFVETDTTNPNNLGTPGSEGRLFRFGADTGAGPLAPAGPFVVATATFTVNQAVGGPSDIDIFPIRLDSQGDDFLLNTTFLPLPDTQLVFSGASIAVAAIPEPTSMTLLGLAIASGAFLRRRAVAC